MKKIFLEAKSENQANYIRAIYESDLVLCSGPAGCGKTLIACYLAARHLKEKKVDKIIISRPLLYCGEDIGALKGSLNEKIMPHFAAIEECMKQFYEREEYDRLVMDGKIKYMPLELSRGATYHNSFMILTESQNCTLEQIKMFATRMGFESKVVIEGDADQTDIKNRSGFQTAIDRLSVLKEVSIVKLDYSDIQRNSLIIKILQALA